MTRHLHIVWICWFVIAMSATNPQPVYLNFDNNVPGSIPKLFAKELIGSKNEHVGYCAFSGDGKEFYYAITNRQWDVSYMLRISSNNLSKKDTLSLKNKQYEGEPFITSDDQWMYFTAVMPPDSGKIWQADIYRSARTKRGWSDPVKLDSAINSYASEWHASISNKQNIFFSSERENGTSALHGDIFTTRLQNGKPGNVVKLPIGINTNYNDSDPLIAPDESYLIFHSDRPGGFGEHDLYVSFQTQGKWSEPVNMGQSINTASWEMAPSLTPDGKYLLFTRRKAMVTDEPSQIYWVSTTILDQYK